MTKTVEFDKQENKKRSTKITACIVLGTVFALALFILISSLATVSLNPSFVARPDEIHVYKAGASRASGQITKDAEEYDDFMSYYDKMFSSSFLSALFNGRLTGYTLSTKQLSTKKNVYDDFVNPYIKFKYDDEIALTYKNGADYKNAYKTTETVTFKELYFELNEANVSQGLTMYVVDYANSSSAKTYYVEVSLVANTSNLYTNLSDFYISN